MSVVDILRRAGVRVVLASLDSHKRVLGAHNIVIEADNALPEFDSEDFDAIILAGALFYLIFYMSSPLCVSAYVLGEFDLCI